MIQVDFRVIMATNRDLPRAVTAVTLLVDLGFRLHVIPLTLPPLRERQEDIPRFAEFFVHKYGVELKRPAMRLAPEALECLQHYDWPGNVRELENMIQRAVVLSSSAVIQPEDLAFPSLGSLPPLVSVPDVRARLEAVEKEAILQALQAHGGDKRTAARALDIGLSTWRSSMETTMCAKVR